MFILYFISTNWISKYILPRMRPAENPHGVIIRRLASIEERISILEIGMLEKPEPGGYSIVDDKLRAQL